MEPETKKEIKAPQARNTHPAQAGRGLEGRQAQEAHVEYDEYDDFDDENALPSIPAREGYAQRWVRVSEPSLGMADAATNISRRARGRWEPRPASTVDRKYQGLSRKLFGDTGGDVIRISEMILMERPMKYQQRREAKLAEKNDQIFQNAQYGATSEQLPGNAQFSHQLKEQAATGKRAVHMASEA